MIAAYLDESFDPKQPGCFVVGGIIGRGVPIFELERRWKLLREMVGIDFYKASECQAGKGQFSKFLADPSHMSPDERSKLDNISHDFLRLIVNPIPFDCSKYLYVHGLGILNEDFYEVIDESANARAVLGDNPYRLAYDFAMIQCAWLIKQLDMGDRVAFVCDKHEQYSALALAAYSNFKATNPHAAEHMGTFGFADDKDCEPLQAADAAVFEVRRALNISLGQRPGVLRSQFHLLADADVMTLIMHATKDQLRHIAKTHNPGEPFKLDVLMERQIDDDIRL